MYNDQEVRDILSQQHLYNTADAIGKHPNDVTADDLIAHWKRFHVGMHLVNYSVEERQQMEHGSDLDHFDLHVPQPA